MVVAIALLLSYFIDIRSVTLEVGVALCSTIYIVVSFYVLICVVNLSCIYIYFLFVGHFS